MSQPPADPGTFDAAARALCALTAAVASQTDRSAVARQLRQAADRHTGDAPMAAALLHRMANAAHQAAPADGGARGCARK